MIIKLAMAIYNKGLTLQYIELFKIFLRDKWFEDKYKL